jgi:DNA-binding response OmpR family regulator
VPKILIVEDDAGIADSIAEALLRERYVVDKVDNVTSGDSYLKSIEYDVVVLDWQLPDGEGIDLCRAYRNHGGTAPILMLTARSGIEDKLTGLDMGADDYLTKPFEMGELLARVRALLRRPRVMQAKVFTARGITLDPAKRMVKSAAHEELKLYPKEFALLELFMSNPGKVFSVNDLLDKVWPTDDDASVDTVRTTILRLRQKIESDDANPLIRTLRNVGYRLDP